LQFSTINIIYICTRQVAAPCHTYSSVDNVWWLPVRVSVR